MKTELEMAWKQLEGWAGALKDCARQLRTGEQPTNPSDERPSHEKVGRLLRQAGEIHATIQELETQEAVLAR